jgi:hypothetical protein
MRFDVTALSAEELVVLIADAKRALYPQAVIAGHELECSSCHEQGTPALIEDGMTVTHQIESLSAGAIFARGWDGSSSSVSEEGDRLLLECQHCFRWHRIPDSIEIEWR